jgi:hypothetical protein
MYHKNRQHCKHRMLLCFILLRLQCTHSGRQQCAGLRARYDKMHHKNRQHSEHLMLLCFTLCCLQCTG